MCGCWACVLTFTINTEHLYATRHGVVVHGLHHMRGCVSVCTVSSARRDTHRDRHAHAQNDAAQRAIISFKTIAGTDWGRKGGGCSACGRATRIRSVLGRHYLPKSTQPKSVRVLGARRVCVEEPCHVFVSALSAMYTTMLHPSVCVNGYGACVRCCDAASVIFVRGCGLRACVFTIN